MSKQAMTLHPSNDDVSNDDSSVGSTPSKQAAIKEDLAFAKTETKAVSCTRILLMALLSATAVIVAVATYKFTSNDEVASFEAAFEAHAIRILQSFDGRFESKLQALDALGVTITSWAIGTGSTFPNVTLPNFESRGSNSRILTESLFMFWSPLVTDETREGWEAYSAANKEHLNEAYADEEVLRAAQDDEFELRRKLQAAGNAEATASMPIYDPSTGEPEASSGSANQTFLPIWQMTPAVPVQSLLNANLLHSNSLHTSVASVLETNKAVLGEVMNLVPNEEPDSIESHFDLFLKNGQYRHATGYYSDDAISSLAYPVFDALVGNRTVVGVIATTLYWKPFFPGILPENVRGVDIVISNTRNQTFSYRINGADVIYLGSGDHHEPEYNHMVQNVSLCNRLASPETRAYGAVALDRPATSLYSVYVYPSKDLESSFKTNKPLLYTIIASAIFLFTSLVFIMYDCLVERRQHIVMDRAIKSTAVVSSLFPAQVRDRLYHEQDIEKGKGDQSKATWAATEGSNKVQNFMSGSGNEDKANLQGQIIADKFDHTTVLFADIVGFTEWSAPRQPEQVFKLLEELYGAFDRIAKKRSVFKVETIGDCYMCVTGLPQPQDDHAVRMAKFASACLRMIKEVTSDLQEELGPGTNGLSMRVGLNSGPVTAGVLRGDKSRFQLFGDTVNTAARMESTGMKDRVQCSQSTYDELVKSGKGYWATPRTGGPIAPKGKGEMATYWLDIYNGSKTRSLVTPSEAADHDDHKTAETDSTSDRPASE